MDSPGILLITGPGSSISQDFQLVYAHISSHSLQWTPILLFQEGREFHVEMSSPGTVTWLGLVDKGVQHNLGAYALSPWLWITGGLLANVEFVAS